MKREYIFEMEIGVRDYELDSEGIVNNANYLHYLEYTRHEFCRKENFSFASMRAEGIDPVLRKVEIEYLVPLRSGDVVRSCLNICRKGPRFIFGQDLYRADDGMLVAKAIVVVVSVKDGKLTRGDEIAGAFAKYL